jgi:rare lipoprotein A
LPSRSHDANSSRERPGVRLFAALAAGVILLTSGCGPRRRPAPTVTRPPTPPTTTKPQPVPTRPPGAEPVLQGETGIASWYGHPYHGRRTANGEVYNMYEMTAAHRTLAFNTMVKVNNLENGRSVTVRINDRGPFVEGRIIDLSFASAQAMGMPSTALVRLEILGRTTPTTEASAPGVYAVQVGAFQDRRNAERLAASIEQRYTPVAIHTFDRGDAVFYRIRVGREASEDAARTLAQKLVQAGFAIQTFVVRLD